MKYGSFNNNGDKSVAMTVKSMSESANQLDRIISKTAQRNVWREDREVEVANTMLVVLGEKSCRRKAEFHRWSII